MIRPVYVSSSNRLWSLFVLAFTFVLQINANAELSVRVAWDPNPEPDIVDYQVYHGVVDAGVTNSVSSNGETELLVSGLQANTDYWFYVTAKNSSGLESDPSAVLQHTTKGGPIAPSITSPAPLATGTIGAAYNHVVVAEGDSPITFGAFGLPPGVSITTAGVISGSPNAVGTYQGVITASNGTLPDATQSFSITVSKPLVAPTITSTSPPASATVGTPYNHTVTATGSSTITFTAFGLPPGVSIAPTGVMSGTPTSKGSFSGVIAASNGTQPDATQSFSITVAEPVVAPTITSTPPLASATVGSPYNHTVTATGSSTITFSATGLPPGVSIAPTGVMSGTPTSEGSFSGVIAASNGTQPDATQSFSITVSEPVVAPTITSTPPPASATVGSPYNHTVAATGSSTITFSATGLPPGMSMTPSGFVSGFPTASGPYNGIIRASNGTSPDATQSFSIVVSPPSDPLSVTINGNLIAVSPAQFQLPANLEGTPDSSVTIRWQQLEGPSVLIDSSSDISPSIQLTTAGEYSFQIQVSDRSNSDQGTIYIKLLEPAVEPSEGSEPIHIYPLQVLFDGVDIYWDSTPGALYHIGVKHDMNLPYWNVVETDIPSHGDVYTRWVDDSIDLFQTGFYTIFEEQ